MTKILQTSRCLYCRRPLAGRAGARGRPASYCKRSHRQRAYEARRRASTLRVPESQVVVEQTELDRLHDLLYALETALVDVERDLQGRRQPDAYRRAFLHLYRAADDLRGRVIEPVRA